MYKKNAFISLRYGLAKHIRKEMGVDIIDDPAFSSSRDVYLAMCTKIKKSGLGGTEHYPPISEEDLKMMYNGEHHAFNTETPVGLQQKVWFELVYYLCRRGRENLREMSKETFKIGKDASGKEYVCQAVDEADKNHRVTDGPNETPGEGRMYEIKGNPACPVTSFRKYVMKLHPDCDCLWQRPLDAFDEDSDTWYYNRPIGKNPLGQLMKDISKMAKLSILYTNHSVRSTHITTLDNAGYEARHIMRTSGHKSECSIRSYSHRLTDQKKRDIAHTLAQTAGLESVPDPPQAVIQDVQPPQAIIQDVTVPRGGAAQATVVPQQVCASQWFPCFQVI
jgi:hypothetical protein